MAKKIIGGIGSILGLKKKKKADAAAAVQPAKGPIIKQLGSVEAPAANLAALLARRRGDSPTILSDKLGG